MGFSAEPRPGRWYTFDQQVAENIAEPWARKVIGARWPFKEIRALTMFDGQQIIATVMYTRWTGQDIDMHVAAAPGRRWMTRDYLYEAFRYPFEYLKCRRITAAVMASNVDALRFDRHLGFKDEGRMREAADDGGDIILLGMLRNECRFLKETSGLQSKTPAGT